MKKNILSRFYATKKHAKLMEVISANLFSKREYTDKSSSTFKRLMFSIIKYNSDGVYSYDIVAQNKIK